MLTIQIPWAGKIYPARISEQGIDISVAKYGHFWDMKMSDVVSLLTAVEDNLPFSYNGTCFTYVPEPEISPEKE